PVPAERRALWERRARSEGLADFVIWEAGPDGQSVPAAARKTHYPLWYVATAGEAVVALGYDFASHPAAYAALDKALADGLSTATAPLHLPGRPHPTILIFRPVLSGRLLRGFIVAFVPTASFLGAVLGSDRTTEPSVTAVLYQLEAGQPPQPLAAGPSAAAATPFVLPATAEHEMALPEAVFPILAFDRAYALHLRSQPRFLNDYPRRAGPAAVLIGTLFTALITGFTGVALRYRNELESQVEARTTELRRHEAYLATLLNTIGDVVFTVAWPDRRITSVNRSITAVFGYRPDEVIGQSSRLFYLSEADYLAYGRTLVEAQEQGQPHVQRELQLRHKDGHAFWVEAHTVFLAAGAWPGTLITLVRDISARKEAEAQLRASEERYRLLFNSMLNGFVLYEVVYDEAGEPVDYRFLEVNPAFERLTGLRGSEIGGRTLREVLPDVETGWLERYAETVRSGQPVFFDHYSRPLRRHYEVSAYCPRPGQLVSLFNDVTEREQAKARSERQVQRLAALRAIDIATSSTFDLRTVLDVVIQQTVLLTMADAAAVWLVESGDYTLRGVVGRGFRRHVVEQSRMRFGQGLIGRAALERQMVCQSGQGPLDETSASIPADEGFVCAYAAPLIAKGEVKGVLAVFCRHLHEPDRDWLEFFEALAGQAAVAVDNAQLLERLQRAHMELAVAYEATIEGWARALDLRDRETEGHTRRVVELSERLAQALGLSQAEIVHIRRGALLHDIGKMAVPDSILLKPDRLTPEEEALMRRHPLFAYEMLSPIAYLRPALDIPHYHHERWDGSGYPYGLKGEQIPLAARLFAVVDVWDALRSNRPYRRAWSKEEAVAYLQANRGVLFDPRVVDAFLQMLDVVDDER
ncbi:MAG: PAS domain S-box protein, partial [Anaerolineae bacterium]|nr:PAS domain S-box protein [Caldilineales bacterium]MDW8268342.1 PAS domain S-box protein [Anaerolineae bacterium]